MCKWLRRLLIGDVPTTEEIDDLWVTMENMQRQLLLTQQNQSAAIQLIEEIARTYALEDHTHS